MDKILIKRGMKEKLEKSPPLSQGELFLAKDEERLYVGGPKGNIPIATQQEVDEITAQLEDNTNKIGILSNRADWMSVKEFGAKGDGVTDDTDAIQAAIDYVSSNRGILYFPSGIYYTTRTLYVKSAICLFGGFEKGDVGTGADKSKGAMIRYAGTGTAIEVKPDSGMIYGFKIKNIRLGSTGGKASKGLSLINVSESDIKECHINGGFNVGLYINNTSITNIDTCDFSANDIGILFDYLSDEVRNDAINIYGCNFWLSKIAHIKMHQATSVNIFNNWLEYSPIALWIDNGSAGGAGLITNVKFYDNVVRVGDSVKYPNSRSVKVTATDLTKKLTVRTLFVERNQLYNSNTDHVIEFVMSGATANSYAYARIANNQLWGGQISAIKADTGAVSLELSNNDCLNGYYGSTVDETSGRGRFVGIDKKYDYMKVTGALRLGNSASITPSKGDIYFDTTTNTIKCYDGTSEKVIPYRASSQADSTATDIAGLRADFNALLQKLRAANIIAP